MIKNNTQKSCLAIIAGTGVLPQKLIEYCQRAGREFCIIGICHQTDPEIFKQGPHVIIKLGQVKKAIKFLNKHQVKDIVLIGGVRRPSVFELKFDFLSLSLLFKYGLGRHGDDAVLKIVDQILTQKGFELHGVHEYLPELLMPEGILGSVKPRQKNQADFDKGIDVLKMLGQADVGQSCVIQSGMVLGVEAIEGTDELIGRCGAYQRKGSKPVLVKMKKQDQDERFDLPTIGPKTIEVLHAQGYAGVALQAGAALVVELEKVIKLANLYGLFIIGFEEEAHDKTR